jgi:hypothetical protein
MLGFYWYIVTKETTLRKKPCILRMHRVHYFSAAADSFISNAARLPPENCHLSIDFIFILSL